MFLVSATLMFVIATLICGAFLTILVIIVIQGVNSSRRRSGSGRDPVLADSPESVFPAHSLVHTDTGTGPPQEAILPLEIATPHDHHGGSSHAHDAASPSHHDAGSVHHGATTTHHDSGPTSMPSHDTSSSHGSFDGGHASFDAGGHSHG